MFNELPEQQKKLDAEIDAQLSRREEDLRFEEEVMKFSCALDVRCEMYLSQAWIYPWVSTI